MRLLFPEHDEVSPLTVALVVTLALLFGRYLFLRSQRSADIGAPANRLPMPFAATSTTPLPSSASWFWPNRKERLDKQTQFIRAHTDYILARIEQAKAMGGLVRARMELAEILASLQAPAPALLQPGASPSPPSSLSLREIAEIVHVQIPAHRGHRFRRIADSVPVIADSA